MHLVFDQGLARGEGELFMGGSYYSPYIFIH